MKTLKLVALVILVIGCGVAFSQNQKPSKFTETEEISSSERKPPSYLQSFNPQGPVTWTRTDGTELAHILAFEYGPSTPNRTQVLDLVAYSPWGETGGSSSITLQSRAGGVVVPGVFNLLAYGSTHSTRSGKTFGVLSVMNGFVIGDISTLTEPTAMLDVKGSAKVENLQWETTASRPTCNLSNRGKTWFVAGASGVADTFEVCRKDSSNTYGWVTLF